MTKNQFTNLIRKCRSDLFTEIAVEKDGVFIPVTRMCNSKNDGNGVAYDVVPETCNIQAVGQRVRLYIPNHSFKDKYAEVIGDGGYNHPAKVVFDDNTNTVTETYNLIDGTVETRSFTLNIENEGLSNEEVTAITFPDGSVMALEGFIIG